MEKKTVQWPAQRAFPKRPIQQQRDAGEGTKASAVIVSVAPAATVLGRRLQVAVAASADGTR